MYKKNEENGKDNKRHNISKDYPIYYTSFYHKIDAKEWLSLIYEKRKINRNTKLGC